MPPVETPRPDESPRAAAHARATKIFISYRRRDFAAAPVAELLYNILKSRFGGKQVFMDVGSLQGGTLFREDIAAALASCQALLAVIGPQWLGAADEHGGRRLDDPSDMVRHEIATALGRGVNVIPVLVHGAPLPREDELPDDLKPLSQHQSQVIRSGGLDEDVGKLVGLLKQTLRRRRARVRRALAVTEAVLLAATVSLLYCFSTAALPVALSPKEGNIPLPTVNYHKKQELVIEGLPPVGAGGLLLRHDGEDVSDVRVGLESGRASAKTLEDIESSNPKWGKDWTHVAYTSEVSLNDQPPNFDRTCSTTVEVKAAHDSEAVTQISFLQRPPPLKSSDYREVAMRADKELAVMLKTMPPKGGVAGADGPGCSKRLTFGDDSSVTAPKGAVVEIYASPGSILTLRFGQWDRDRTSGRKGLMRFGEAPHDSVEPFTFGVAPLSARAIKVRSYADGNGADGNVNERVNAGEKVIFSASSVDDFLLLRGLSVGPDYLRFALEERAYVTSEGVNLPSSFRERITQNSTQAMLLLIATVGLVMSLVYTLARL